MPLKHFVPRFFDIGHKSALPSDQHHHYFLDVSLCFVLAYISSPKFNETM